MTRLRDERGMTLTELIAAIFVATILFGAAVTTFVTFLDTSTKADNEAQAQEVARSTIERMTSQLRNGMSTGTNGAQPIQHISDFDLVFLAPDAQGTVSANNPRALTYHRYCLGNNNNKSEQLWYQTSPFNSASQAAAPPRDKCPSTSWTTRFRSGDHLVNRQNPVIPLFTPTYDATGNVTHVAITAQVDWNPDMRPPAVELRSKVSLRNLNRAPTASVTCKGLANGHAICDASASSDPDGQALNYAWEVNGSLLSDEKTYRLDYSPLPPGSVRTFKVTVSDSGNATSSASQSVSIPIS
jgi:type II secretory pathway pseudopilin PulG